MEIFRFLKPKQKKQFVSEIDFITNLNRQSHLAIETLVQLRELHIEEEDKLKIDYFFYTNTAEKSQAIAKEMQKRNYLVTYEAMPNTKNLFVVKGQSNGIQMMHEVLKQWATGMCELGYQCDCNFDGWKVSIPTVN